MKLRPLRVLQILGNKFSVTDGNILDERWYQMPSWLPENFWEKTLLQGIVQLGTLCVVALSFNNYLEIRLEETNGEIRILV